MTKGEIIESILKEMRTDASVKRRRPREEDEDEQNVVTHLENLLHDAQPDTDIRTCAYFIDFNVECCTTCHYFMFPYDMPRMIKLKSGECAWVCCAIHSAIMRTRGGEIPVKRPSPEPSAKFAGYKPFAEFFGVDIEEKSAINSHRWSVSSG
jgi:hypothetical protein